MMLTVATFHSQVKLIHWKQTQPQDLEQVFRLRTDGIPPGASKYQKRTHPNVCQNIMGGGGAEMGQRVLQGLNHAASIPTNWTSQLKRKRGECRDHPRVHVTVPEALPQGGQTTKLEPTRRADLSRQLR